MADVTKAVLITGCSSGIGRATAEHLAQHGHTVYATARKPDAIEDLKERGCRVLALDVTDEDSMSAAVREVEDAEGAVGALVTSGVATPTTADPQKVIVLESKWVDYGRDWERREDEKIMDKMKAEGKIKTHPFGERAKLLELVAPVKVAFAKEAGADKVLEAVDAVK